MRNCTRPLLPFKALAVVVSPQLISSFQRSSRPQHHFIKLSPFKYSRSPTRGLPQSLLPRSCFQVLPLNTNSSRSGIHQTQGTPTHCKLFGPPQAQARWTVLRNPLVPRPSCFASMVPGTNFQERNPIATSSKSTECSTEVKGTNSTTTSLVSALT